ncbi:hypothetical protein YC2023_106639 [Brassica napus]
MEGEIVRRRRRLLHNPTQPFSTITDYQVVAIARAALDGFKNEAKKMVVVIVDMERAFVQTRKHHFVCFCFFLALSVLVA